MRIKKIEKKFKYLIIDANNLFWRSWVSSTTKFFMSKGTKLYIGGIEESLQRVRYIQEEYGYLNSKVFFLFDNPSSKTNFRKIISKGDYKHARQAKNAPTGLYKALKVFSEILRNYSSDYRILFAENKEADDLCLPIKEYLKVDYINKALFISADMDWARNIDNNSLWFNWNKLYNQEEFYKKYKFWPKRYSIQLYKAIHGDSSDSIKNAVPNLPEEILLDIVDKFDSLESFIRGYNKQGYPPHWTNKILNSLPQIKVNYALVDFVRVTEPINEIMYKCKRNVLESRIWFETLGFPLELWMRPEKDEDDFFFKTGYVG